MRKFKAKGNFPLDASFSTLVSVAGKKASDLNGAETGIYAVVADGNTFTLDNALFDKSDTDIWKDSIRASVYYVPATPKLWHVSEFTQLYFSVHCQAAYIDRVRLMIYDRTLAGGVFGFDSAINVSQQTELEIWAKRKGFAVGISTVLLDPIAEQVENVAFTVTVRTNLPDGAEIKFYVGGVYQAGNAVVSSGTATKSITIDTAGEDIVVRAEDALNADAFDSETINVVSGVPQADGKVFYTNDYSSDSGARIYAYNAGTDWDITTLSTQITKLLSIASTVDFCFSKDQTKLFVLNATYIHTYNMSTPKDISTINTSYADRFTHGVSNPTCFEMNSDGTKIYIGSMFKITQFTLSTAYLPSTATNNGYFPFESVDPYYVCGWVKGLKINSDNTILLVSGSHQNLDYPIISRINLSTPGVLLSGATIDYAKMLWYPSPAKSLYGLDLSNDGTRMYTVILDAASQTKTIQQLSLSVGWNPSTASVVRSTTLVPYGGGMMYPRIVVWGDYV